MERHDSYRGYFAYELYQQMKKNDKIVVITADLGYGAFDAIQKDFPKRFFNVGASEQAMIGIGVGMALKGLIPFCYSITPFLLYRPLEWIKNYLGHEKIAVKLVGAGVGQDYLDDGFTHWSDGPYNTVISRYPNIQQFYPEEKTQVPKMVQEMVTNKKPSFIHLHR
jgi:transketolase